MNKKFFTPKKVHAYVRAAIQLLFFLFLPSAFTTAFSGIKSVLTQIGTGSPVVMSSFLTVLLALCAYTVVFGRFFCGYACAFGTLGDAVHALYLFLCKKCKKKPVLLKKSWKKPLSFLKYAVLLAIVLLCFTGVYGEITGWSPWDVFSMLRSGNFKVGAYWLGCVLLVLILAGMVFCERFFCRFLCPMGSRLYNAAGAAVLFRPPAKGELCKGLYCLSEDLSVRSGTAGKGQLEWKRGLLPVSEVSGDLP